MNSEAAAVLVDFGQSGESCLGRFASVVGQLTRKRTLSCFAIYSQAKEG
jgi:hypothetical protein